MQNNAPPPTIAPDSSESSATVTKIPITFQLDKLPLTWPLLTVEEQNFLWELLPRCRPLVNALWWMTRATKTRDDQDQLNPFKPFPEKPYFKVLHDDWMREEILYVEKSRSMITSWFFAAEVLHYIMTHQPSKALFMAQDEDRSVVLRDYVWTLYEQQDRWLQELYPVPRPRGKQSYDKLELSGGGSIVA